MAAFLPALRKANQERGFLLCGLDPVQERMPEHLQWKFRNNPVNLLWNFLIPIIDEVSSHVIGYKPNISFFLNFDQPELEDFSGQIALSRMCRYIRENYPNHLLILDAKDGDIGASNDGYFKRAFKGYDAHALTWNPYLGVTCIEQMKKYPGRGIIALARTSNPEGAAFQGVECMDGRPIFMQNVDLWRHFWDKRFPIGLVAGATFPEDLKYLRKKVGAMPLLIPGVGKQGGNLIAVCEYCFGGKTGNTMINVSSDILYANDTESFAIGSRSVAGGYASLINKVWAMR